MKLKLIILFVFQLEVKGRAHESPERPHKLLKQSDGLGTSGPSGNAKQGTLTALMSSKYNINSQRAQAITRKILAHIIQNLLPFRIVEDDSFVDLINFLDPRYTIPSRAYFTKEILPKLYNEAKAKVVDDLARAEVVSLTTDAWSSRATQSYITTTAQFIDVDWKLIEYVLETVHVPESHTAEKLAEVLMNTTTKWKTMRPGLNPVVTDNTAVMPLAVSKTECDWLGCFAHILNLVAQKGLEVSGMKKLLAKIKRIVLYFHKSNIAANELKEKQVQLKMASTPSKAKKLIMEVKTRWNSSYDMLVSYLDLEPAVVAALASPTCRAKSSDIDTLRVEDINNAKV